MIAVRINTDKEQEGKAFLAMTKIGPIKCLPDHVYLITDEHLRHLQELNVPYEDVPRDEVANKAKKAFLF
jgi:hypothetical protein